MRAPGLCACFGMTRRARVIQTSKLASEHTRCMSDLRQMNLGRHMQAREKPLRFGDDPHDTQASTFVYDRANEASLSELESCEMPEFRKLIANGGAPMFVLARDSSFLRPIWLLLARDQSGKVWRVVTPANPFVRRLVSIRQVYRIARNCGLISVEVPVERERKVMDVPSKANAQFGR